MSLGLQIRPEYSENDRHGLNLLRQHYLPMDHSTASSDRYFSLWASLRCLDLGQIPGESHPKHLHTFQCSLLFQNHQSKYGSLTFRAQESFSKKDVTFYF